MAVEALARATRAACAAPGPEQALRGLTGVCPVVLGDKQAHLRPGALKPAERQFSVCGAFMLTPDRRHNLLLAEVGFPPEQHRLLINATLGHPGWVVEHQEPLILANRASSSARSSAPARPVTGVRDEMTWSWRSRRPTMSAALASAFRELLRGKIGVDIQVELVDPGATAAVTEIERRQKPIRLIDRRPRADRRRSEAGKRARTLRHVCTAVDVDELTRDPARLLRGEEDGNSRDLIRLGDTAERDLAERTEISSSVLP